MNFSILQQPGWFQPRTALVAVEAGLVVFVAAQAAALVWAAATPIGPLGAPPMVRPAQPPAVDLSILGRFDPFYRAGAPVGAATQGAPAGGGALTLFGLRVEAGGRGSAIIGTADGRQGAYVVGDTVEPGLVLRAVTPDHALLVRGAQQVRLTFPEPGGSAPAAAPPPAFVPATAPAGELSAQGLLAAASLQPRMREGRIAGYTVVPRGGGAPLAASGLRAGDVVLAVNGSELNPERMGELESEISGPGEVELRVERAGQIITSKLRTGSR